MTVSAPQTVSYDYDRQDASGASCTAHAWAKVPAPLTPAQREAFEAHVERESEALRAQAAADAR